MTVVAKSSVRVLDPSGCRSVFVHKGASYQDNDALVRQHRWLFVPVEEVLASEQPRTTADLGERSASMHDARMATVESMTSAPGEKRSVGGKCPHCDYVATSRQDAKEHLSREHRPVSND